MTDPDSTDSSYDPLAALTVHEIETGNRQIKASMVAAITNQSEQYERALAAVLWLHARRTDPGANLSTYLALTFGEVNDQLTALGAAEGPTTPGSSQ